MALILAAASWFPGAPAGADTADEIARRIAELEAELAGVREGIA